MNAIKTLEKFGMQNKVIFSSNDDISNCILGSYNGIFTAWDVYDTGKIDNIINTNYKYIMIPYDVFTDEFLKKTQKSGKEAIVYRIDTIDTLEDIYNKGIKMIMTDNFG